MEITPRRKRNLKSMANLPTKGPHNDIFADCPEFNYVTDPTYNRFPDSETETKEPLTTPKQLTRRSTSKNSGRKSCGKSSEDSVLTSLCTPRSIPALLCTPVKSKSVCTPELLSRQDPVSNLILPVTPKPPSKSNFGADMLSPSISTEDACRAVLEGKKTLNEIFKRMKMKGKPSSSGFGVKRQLSRVEGITHLPFVRSPLKEQADQACNSCPSNRGICDLESPLSRKTSRPNKLIRTPIAPSNIPDSDEDSELYSDLPPTQPVSSFILKDVVAYVEVRTSVDREARGVKNELQKLGATVANTFNKKVTHVIFMNGMMSTYKKAVERNIPLVSVLWIEECKKLKVKVSERLYPSTDLPKYESPNLFETKRKKFMPELDALKKKIAMKRKKRKISEVDIDESQNTEQIIKSFRQRESIVGPQWAREVSNGNSVVRALVSVAKISEKEYHEIVNRPPTPEGSDDDYCPGTPLAVRLLRQLVPPKCNEDGCSSSKGNTSNFKPSECSNQSENENLMNVAQTTTSQVMINVKSTETISNKLVNHEKCNEFTSIEKLSKPNDLGDKLCTITETSIHSSTLTPMTSAVDMLKNKYNFNVLSENRILPNNSNEGESCSAPKVVEGIKKLDLSSVARNEENDESLLSQDISTTEKTGNETPTNNLNCSKGLKSRKRKLMPLSQNPILLTPTDDEPPLELTQNPYINEEVQCKRKRVSIKPSRSRSSIGSSSQDADNSSEAVKTESQNVEYMKCKESYSQRKSRRSSVDFITFQRRRSLRTIIAGQSHEAIGSRLPSIVCTSLHSEEIGVILSVVDKLGGYVIESSVTGRTTHVVAKEPRRTLKLLKGMARGCWIVKQEWILRSLEEGKWLDEEEFELTEFSHAVQQYRIEKLSFGPAYKPDLFSSCGPIFVSSSSCPPKEDVAELVALCGGQVVPTVRTAQIVIGQATHYKEVECVSVQWVLDSITNCVLEPIDNYIVRRTTL